jgi:hypothetical protein
MASTYSDRLKLELMATGANANVWGTNTNNNLNVVDSFGAGYLSKSVAGSADVTLTTADADPSAEASNKIIEFTGTLTGDIKVFVPAVENNYIFFNNTAGSFTLTVAPTGHTSNGVAIVQGAHTMQYCTGDTVVDLFANSLGKVSVKNLVNVANTVKIQANGELTATSFTGNGAGLDGVSTLDQGTQMVFLESSAPTGWTQNTDASLANSTLRVVTGSAGTGGSTEFASCFDSAKTTTAGDITLDTAATTVVTDTIVVGNTTLGTPTIASHNHTVSTSATISPYGGPGGGGCVTLGTTGSGGGGGSHNHPAAFSASISGSVNTPTSYAVPNMDIKHANTIVCSKD